MQPGISQFECPVLIYKYYAYSRHLNNRRTTRVCREPDISIRTANILARFVRLIT
jgi:hypothetical protein